MSKMQSPGKEWPIEHYQSNNEIAYALSQVTRKEIAKHFYISLIQIPHENKKGDCSRNYTVEDEFIFWYSSAIYLVAIYASDSVALANSSALSSAGTLLIVLCFAG